LNHHFKWPAPGKGVSEKPVSIVSIFSTLVTRDSHPPAPLRKLGLSHRRIGSGPIARTPFLSGDDRAFTLLPPSFDVIPRPGPAQVRPRSGPTTARMPRRLYSTGAMALGSIERSHVDRRSKVRKDSASRSAHSMRCDSREVSSLGSTARSQTAVLSRRKKDRTDDSATRAATAR